MTNATNICLLFVAIGAICGVLGLAGWAAECFEDALTAAHLDELDERGQR